MKKILIVTYMPLHKEPRVLRQVQALKDEYKLSTIGYTQIPDDNIIYYPLRKITRTKRNILQKLHYLFSLLLHNKKYIKNLLHINFDIDYILSLDISEPDVIIAHDWEGLFLSSYLIKKHNWNSKIYYDAHEYSPNQFSASLRWRIFVKPLINYSLKQFKSYIAAMSTVSDGIARKYERYFNYQTGYVSVITNASDYQDTLKPNNVSDNKIKLIHHGNASKLRKLEQMIKMMKYLDSEVYELTFMLIKQDPDYYNYLVNLSLKYKNINFIEPVQFSDISKTLNLYDIGVFLILPENFNYKYCLPNKLFEFVQARLAVAIGPSIEMVKIVKKYNLGIYSKDFSSKSLAKQISSLTSENIHEYKKNSDKNAFELSSNLNITRIKSIISKLL